MLCTRIWSSDAVGPTLNETVSDKIDYKYMQNKYMQISLKFQSYDGSAEQTTLHTKIWSSDAVGPTLNETVSEKKDYKCLQISL